MDSFLPWRQDIEIGLRPGAADLGILGKFAFSVDFCYFSKVFLHFSDSSFFGFFSGSGGVRRGRGRSLHARGRLLGPGDQYIKKSKN